jgi:hypothetical protein
MKNANTSVVGVVIVALLCNGIRATRASPPDYVLHKEYMIDAFLWSAANGVYRFLAFLLMRQPGVAHMRCSAVAHSDAGMFLFICCAKLLVCMYSHRCGCAHNQVQLGALLLGVAYIEICGYQQ